MKTIIIGLGNPILTDDGIGVLCAFEIEKSLPAQFLEDIHVTEACVGGIRLMELMEGYDRAVIIDAIISKNGQSPGTVYKMTLDDLKQISPTQHSSSAHDTSLVTAIEMGNKLEIKLPAEFYIYAVEVENVEDFSDKPSPAVASAVTKVKQMVLTDVIKFMGPDQIIKFEEE